MTANSKFGRHMLEHFPLDPNVISLNNGSFGCPPKAILEYAQKISNDIEYNADIFYRIDSLQKINHVREKIAKFLNAETDEIVLVPNATTAMNTILRNFEWRSQDIIITFSTNHAAALRTAEYISDIHPHPQVVNIALLFPTTHAAIVQQFKKTVDTIKTEGRVLAIIDSIISKPGYLLPWQELVRVCKEADILSVIDAAHSLGQEVGINLSESQPDFWYSNTYKWLYGKRAAAVLYIPKRNQKYYLSSVPTSMNYKRASSGQNTFIAQSQWTGAVDLSAYLSIPEALRFRESIGGERVINDYCHSLAVKGGQLVARILGTSVLDLSGEGTLNMTNVELPLQPSIQPNEKVEMAFARKLLKERKAHVVWFFQNNRWWIRICAQIWNDLEDFEKVARILVVVCKEINQEFGHESTRL